MPLGDSISSSVQLSLPGGKDVAYTEFIYKGQSNSTHFEAYFVRHQRERDIDAIWHGNEIKRLVQNHMFEAFYERDRRYLLMQVRKDVAIGAMSRLALNAHEHGLRRRDYEMLNLKHLERAVGKTSGGYFRDLKIANVKGAALWGEDVILSEEWLKYDEAGDLSTIVVHVPVDADRVAGILLSQDRSISLYKSMGQADDLDFIRKLQAEIDTLLQD